MAIYHFFYYFIGCELIGFPPLQDKKQCGRSLFNHFGGVVSRVHILSRCVQMLNPEVQFLALALNLCQGLCVKQIGG